MATIITKNSSTASAVPAAGSLVQGELAVNVTDKKVYTKDSSGTVQKLVGSLGNQEASAVAITGGTESGVAITGGTINNTPIGATTAAAVTGTTVTATVGFVGALTGNVTGNTTGTHTGAVTGNVAGDLTGNVTASSGTSSFNNVTINGTLDMNSGSAGTITGLATPSASSDAANKGYVDTAISNLVGTAPSTLDTLGEIADALNDDANLAATLTASIATKVSKAGDTMTGALAMGSNKITGLGAPTAGTDAATKTYVDTADALKLSLSGGTMTGNIVMGANKVTSTATPTTDDDLTRKAYVDSILGSATSAATSASQAATSATNAANSASAASSSASAASASASAAAASYDSFDDRYLGAKSSAPTVDNDGNALLTGAIYWNSTSSTLWVWTGSAWTQATLTAGSFATLAGTETLTNKTISTVNQTALQYATSNLPAIKPSLNLDFANTKQLDPRITFTRASTATYYDGKTTAMAEQNLLLRSQEFDNVAWNDKINVTVTANATTAPDGTTTAEQIDFLGTTEGVISQTIAAPVVGQTYVFSVWLRADSNQTVTLRFRSTVTQSASVTTAWQRFTFTRTVAAANETFIGIGGSDTTAKTIYAWGAQLEQRSAVSAYTATTTQPITNYIPVLLTAASGVARFEHNPVTGESLGLEIEEQRTNAILQSETFSTTWIATRSSITDNTVVSPAGTLTADVLIGNTENSIHFISQNPTTTATSTTFSIYAKAAGRNFVALQISDSSNTGRVTYFNLSTGVVGTTGTGITASMVSVGNGWYRCVATVATAYAGSNTCVVAIADVDGSLTYTGDGYSGIYIWGAQLEAGAFATSYIPTTSAQVTRAADAASMTGTNFSSWYRADEGTFYAEFAPASSNFGSNKNIFLASDGTTSNYNGLRYASSGSQPAANVGVAGTLQSNILSGTMVAGTWYKMAGAYKVNDFAMSRDAGTVGTDTSGTLPVVTQAEIGALAGTNISSQMIKKLAYYPIRVDNTNLQALTS